MIPQPSAKPGERTYCPVSGVVFTIGDKSIRRTAGAQSIYFCCEACAGWFDAHRDHVIASRGLARDSPAK